MCVSIIHSFIDITTKFTSLAVTRLTPTTAMTPKKSPEPTEQPSQGEIQLLFNVPQSIDDELNRTLNTYLINTNNSLNLFAEENNWEAWSQCTRTCDFGFRTRLCKPGHSCPIISQRELCIVIPCFMVQKEDITHPPKTASETEKQEKSENKCYI